MSYSPSEDMLAVGSHDNYLYIYSVKKGAYTKYAGPLKAHSSYITCLDWSLDGSYIRTNCGAYELLFFNVANKKQDSGGASGTVSTEWASQHCKLGWSVQGIFPPGCDGTHINGVDMSGDQELIATGDDYGLVNIYRNPALENHKARSFRGHSEHVTRVLFTMDD
jgi:WD40 repeat protein